MKGKRSNRDDGTGPEQSGISAGAGRTAKGLVRTMKVSMSTHWNRRNHTAHAIPRLEATLLIAIARYAKERTLKIASGEIAKTAASMLSV